METNKLSFPADAPPLAVIVAAKIAGLSLPADPSLPSGSSPILHFSDGGKLRGLYVLLRHIGRVAKIPNFYSRDAFESTQIDEWLEYAPVFASGSEFEGACGYVDGYLLHHTFLVGHSLSIADIAIWSALAGTGQRWQSLRNSKKYQNLVRWFNSIRAEYNAALNEVTAMYIGKKGLGTHAVSIVQDQQVSTSHSSSVNGAVTEKGVGGNRPAFEVHLPDAQVGKARVRFAPEPSGYLHIGHSKAALLNKYFAERYEGKLIVGFDDMNPDKESNEFVDNLLKDIETLGIKYETVTYTSDYFPKMIEMAEKMIREGKSYVDDTPREKMKQERMDGIESKCRSNSVEENLSLWNEMIAGSERGLMCCLRGKLNMQDPNKSLRDPVLPLQFDSTPQDGCYI